MPNWCENTLTVNGTEIQLKDFKERYFSYPDPTEISGYDDRDYLDFNKVIPMPESEKDNWYSWNIENWGCKWNCCPMRFYDDSDGGYYFETPWGPAKEVYEKLIVDNPNLDICFQYLELGGPFCGSLKSDGKGSFVSLESSDFEEVHKFAIEHFGYEASDFECEELVVS